MRLCVMSTNKVRKIASRETTIVRKLKGNGSNGTRGDSDEFRKIHSPNQAACKSRAVPLAAQRVIAAAAWSNRDRA